MPNLDADGQRVLGHFWDSRGKKVRGKLPLNVLAFLDDEAQGKEHIPSAVPNVLVTLAKLQSDNFVRALGGPYAEKVYELNVEGRVFIERKHPYLFVLWDQLIERTPRIVNFAIVLIGIVASVFGIIDFFRRRHS